MKRETELLMQYREYIWRNANAFYRKSHLPRYMLEDIFQEACVAFLLYLREVPNAEDALLLKQFIIPTSRIRFHLYQQFLDAAGMGLTSKCVKAFLRNHLLPVLVDSVEVLAAQSGLKAKENGDGFWLDGADTLKAVYLRDWLHSMAPQDRKITVLFMSGYNGREVAERMNMNQSTVNLRWRNCQKTYLDYVDVA